MSGAIHQPPSFGSTHMEDGQKQQLCGQESFRHPLHCSNSSRTNSRHEGPAQKDSLWMDGWCDAFQASEELANRRSLLSRVDLSVHSGTASSDYSAKAPEDGMAFVNLLRACSRRRDLCRGTRLHDEILRRGLLETCSDALITMYAKCGQLGKAQALVDMHKSRDVITWTALIAGYAREGRGHDALDCFRCMQQEGVFPDAVTFICLLKACAAIGAGGEGQEIHDEVVKRGLLHDNIVLATAIIDMHAKCGALSKARRVLEELPSRTVVAWNALIAGYAQDGQGDQALICFEKMQHEGIQPDAITYASILKACASIRDADKGKLVHDEITRRGLLRNDLVLGTAVADMYAKCGAPSKAQRVLEEMSCRDVVLWSTVIAGYAQENQAEQALVCFQRMRREGILPNAVTYACVLKVCATIRAVDKGKQIHDEIMRQGLLRNNVVLGTALVDMYAKCGALSQAQQVFDQLPSRDVVSWSALIAVYAQEGQGKQALQCFARMQHDGILPNAVTFLCVLSVCSHLGLVEEGHGLFANMRAKYQLKPSLECYTCMVDLYGRAGHLEKAVQLILQMPSSDYSTIWLSLLGACQKWGDVNVGRWAFEQAIEVDRSDGRAYVLMANLYASAGMEENVKEIEEMRAGNKAWRKPGHSWWIDPSNRVHAFSVGDTSHAQVSRIHAKLDEIGHRMVRQRSSLDVHWRSRDTYDAAAAHLMCRHPEQLAVACALINAPRGATIHVAKNARMCGDCHVATSLISKMEMRAIVVADAAYHHHFEDGKCSCSDYF